MAVQSSTLVELGFSEYEARTYRGLVRRAPMTGYAVAKETGVPQPKVYETLNRLAERGAVLQVGEDPATWAAVPPARLLAQLDSEFRRRMATAELELARLGSEELEAGRVRPYRETGTWRSTRLRAADVIRRVGRRLYLSGHADQLRELADEVLAADGRGVRTDVLCFGEPPFTLAHGTVVRHRSTEGTVYPHHQARHLGVVADGTTTVWALAPNGADWSGVWSENDDLLTAVVKGFIRHDLFVQRIFDDLGEQLVERYGPSLEGLMESPAADPQAGPRVRSA